MRTIIKIIFLTILLLGCNNKSFLPKVKNNRFFEIIDTNTYKDAYFGIDSISKKKVIPFLNFIDSLDIIKLVSFDNTYIELFHEKLPDQVFQFENSKIQQLSNSLFLINLTPQFIGMWDSILIIDILTKKFKYFKIYGKNDKILHFKLKYHNTIICITNQMRPTTQRKIYILFNTVSYRTQHISLFTNYNLLVHKSEKYSCIDSLDLNANTIIYDCSFTENKSEKHVYLLDIISFNFTKISINNSIIKDNLDLQYYGNLN